VVMSASEGKGVMDQLMVLRTLDERSIVLSVTAYGRQPMGCEV
jgi:hypothetical protein